LYQGGGHAGGGQRLGRSGLSPRLRVWLLHFNPDGDSPEARWLQPLSPDIARTIDRTGGTFMHTTEIHPGKVKEDDLPDFMAVSKHCDRKWRQVRLHAPCPRRGRGVGDRWPDRHTQDHE